ncbi:hypothetical protein [Nonomuraea typhae]|uniref:Uncharacterized protein n=1 Tax=Nonomuraea typhae TaxID=2603600 RepID=A0ABW7ZCT8_9ACTN
MDDAGDGQRAALAVPLVRNGAAFVEPGDYAFPGDLEQRDAASLVLAVQADGADAGGDGDVFDVEVPPLAPVSRTTV